MVREVVEATNNTSLLTTALPLLIREHEFWTTGPKAVQLTSSTGQTYRLSRYYADLEEPRPESYREDAELGAQLAGEVC
jgi:alpha,alpha-trehalase